MDGLVNFAIAAVEVCVAAGGALILAKSAIFFVEQQTMEAIERCGKFSWMAKPGLNFKWPILDKRARKLQLRLVQSDFEVEVRTRDNVFVKVPISLHHRITDPFKAYNELSTPIKQMESFASNAVRAKAAMMDFAHLYESQNDIRDAIKQALDEKIGKYGFLIEDVVVSQPLPDAKVIAASNQVVSSQRLLEAARNEAQAAKIKTVAAAEATSEAMALYGQGVAKERKAIAEGSDEAIRMLTKDGLTKEQAMAMLIVTNGQQAIVKASEGPGTVIIGSVKGGDTLDDMGELVAKLTALSRTPVVQQSPAPQPA